MKLPAILLPLFVLFLAGCQTPPDTERPNLIEPLVVKRGTTGEELIAVLGEPDIRHPVAEYSVDAEIWIYNRTIGSNSQLVFAGTEERLYWDPFRRRMMTIEVPVYLPEVTSNIEVTEILMFKEQVYSWERRTGERREVEGLTR